FWSTAGTPNLLGQALPETRRLATFLLFFCYFFAIFLLFQGPLSLSVALLLLSFCYFFAIGLLPLSFCAP
ncbi:hypothetical protein ODS10_24015, partial [Escherichia coli]|nr:hypothetical protein [Escherichia coli]